MEQNGSFSIVTAIFMTLIVTIILAVLIKIAAVNMNKESNDNTYTYGIIFYPDGRTTIEGYVEKYVYEDDIIKVTIDGEEYQTNSKNVVLIKKKDLNVNKEKINGTDNN